MPIKSIPTGTSGTLLTRPSDLGTRRFYIRLGRQRKEGRTYYLPYSWNYIHPENTDYLSEDLKNECLEAGRSPRIIHFAGVREKPWICPVYVKNFQYFRMYAARTPFLDIIIQRMNQNSIIGQGYSDFVINEIKHRHNGLRFIIKCFTAWLTREKE